MKIYAPVKDFDGFRANVRFVKGVGETDDLQMIQWFKTHGYKVEETSSYASVKTNDELSQKLYEKCDEVSEVSSEKRDEPDFEAMTPNELRDWMKANGLGSRIKNIRNKEKLLEISRG